MDSTSVSLSATSIAATTSIAAAATKAAASTTVAATAKSTTTFPTIATLAFAFLPSATNDIDGLHLAVPFILYLLILDFITLDWHPAVYGSAMHKDIWASIMLRNETEAFLLIEKLDSARLGWATISHVTTSHWATSTGVTAIKAAFSFAATFAFATSAFTTTAWTTPRITSCAAGYVQSHHLPISVVLLLIILHFITLQQTTT